MVGDEQLWPLTPLEVGAGFDSPAANLFVERARAVAPGISFVGDEAAAGRL